MNLYIQQKVFSFKDKFTIVDEQGELVYTVEGKMFSLGKKLTVYDNQGFEVAFIEQKVLSMLPKYFIEIAGKDEVSVHKKLSFLRPKYIIEGTDWMLQGDIWDHDYQIVSGNEPVMSLSKEWFTWGDSYELSIDRPEDMLLAVCIALVVDACLESDGNTLS